jgi:ABC-type nitrate/sulfonate/bicarbonate transport system substrate-binding protein
MRALTVALATSGLTKPLKQGRVAAARAKLDFVPVERIVPLMRRMVRGLDFDICEMAFTTYLCARAAGKPITAIPVFVTRNFHHWAAFHGVKSGIVSPRDLEGRIVAVNRGYTVTTGLWVRGILHSEYGVDLAKVTWAPTDDEHVQEYRAPANVTYKFQGRPIAELLLSGDVAAAVGDVQSDSREIKPLIADARNAGIAWFRKTGIYPINHTVVVKDELLAADPGLAQELVAAFAAAKAQYLAQLDAGRDLTSADEAIVALRRVVGDPYPFGVEPNRKALEAIVRFAVEQQVIPAAMPVAELFAGS